MPVAFDIGFEHLKIVWAAVKKGRVLVKKSESIKLPAEFSSLSEKEQADIIQALAKPVINDNKIKGNCYITLNDSRFLIRHVQIPHSRPNEIRAMAFNEMALLYGAKEDDMLCLYNDNDGGLTQRVKCAVINRSVVEAYYDMVKSLSLKPAGFSFHSDAVKRFIKPNTYINDIEIKGRNFVLLDGGMSSCLAHVFVKGEYILSRSTQLGFSRYTDEDKDIFLRKLTGEIAQIIDSSQVYGQGLSIGRIHMFGGGAFYPGIDKGLKEHLGIGVDIITHISGVSADTDIAYYLNGIAALSRYVTIKNGIGSYELFCGNKQA